MTNQTLLTTFETLGFQAEDITWDTPKVGYVKVNGIKFELKDQRAGFNITVAYYAPDAAEAIRNAFPGYADTKQGVYFNGIKTAEELTALATRIRDFIVDEGLERIAVTRTARKTDNNGFFEKTAAAIKQLVDIEAWDFLNGRLNAFDDHDDIITIGKDEAVLANPDAPQWREHIVPCTLIKEEAIRMAQAGATIPQIAQMLKENLAIVIITAEEAKALDAVYQTTMPAGWTFGDNIFARLDAMNIAY